jgi:hypothetical protein
MTQTSMLPQITCHRKKCSYVTKRSDIFLNNMQVTDFGIICGSAALHQTE